MAKGIHPVFRKIRGSKTSCEFTVTSRVNVPQKMVGARLSFITALVESGKIPPVKSLDALSADTPYVLLFDKEVKTVAP
jgi:hypothetical protein